MKFLLILSFLTVLCKGFGMNEWELVLLSRVLLQILERFYRKFLLFWCDVIPNGCILLQLTLKAHLDIYIVAL